MNSKSILAVLPGLLLLNVSSAVQAAVVSVDVTVNALSGPWNYGPGFNDGLEYGINDHFNATVVSSSSGFDFTPGKTLTISYLGGMTSAYFDHGPEVDAQGYTPASRSEYVTDDGTGSSGTVFPSFYMDGNGYPMYLMELVGAFTDALGNVVGTPFNVSLGTTAVIPSGATRLQLGMNDDVFGDNQGELQVRIAQDDGSSTVPDGGASWLLFSGALGTMVVARKRWKTGA